MVGTRKRLLLGGCCLCLAACASPGDKQQSYTMQDCRDILASANKPGTREDAARRESERTCANILGISGRKPAAPASAPRAG